MSKPRVHKGFNCPEVEESFKEFPLWEIVKCRNPDGFDKIAFQNSYESLVAKLAQRRGSEVRREFSRLRLTGGNQSGRVMSGN